MSQGVTVADSRITDSERTWYEQYSPLYLQCLFLLFSALKILVVESDLFRTHLHSLATLSSNSTQRRSPLKCANNEITVWVRKRTRVSWVLCVVFNFLLHWVPWTCTRWTNSLCSLFRVDTGVQNPNAAVQHELPMLVSLCMSWVMTYISTPSPWHKLLWLSRFFTLFYLQEIESTMYYISCTFRTVMMTPRRIGISTSHVWDSTVAERTSTSW